MVFRAEGEIVFKSIESCCGALTAAEKLSQQEEDRMLVPKS